jgi:cytochrome c biogenesis protein CcmG, thiol:disulfide interchange protein DsbE
MKWITLLFVCFGLFFFIQAQVKETETVRKAPEFKLENIDGKYIELSKEIGSGPILISFWATWCKPCIEELSQYKTIFKEYESKGVKVIAISTDNEKTTAKVRPLVKSKAFPFTILLDPNSEVARKFYVPSVPYVVILDKLGNIAYTHLGYMKGDEIKIREKLDELLIQNVEHPKSTL